MKMLRNFSRVAVVATVFGVSCLSAMTLEDIAGMAANNKKVVAALKACVQLPIGYVLVRKGIEGVWAENSYIAAAACGGTFGALTGDIPGAGLVTVTDLALNGVDYYAGDTWPIKSVKNGVNDNLPEWATSDLGKQVLIGVASVGVGHYCGERASGLMRLIFKK